MTDQIDALTTLSTNPMENILVAPRLLAGIVRVAVKLVLDRRHAGRPWRIHCFDTLKTWVQRVGIFDQHGEFRAGAGCDFRSGEGGGVWVSDHSDGGCYQGYNSKGGAQGVGAARRLAAVVTASILILAFDYVPDRAVLQSVTGFIG